MDFIIKAKKAQSMKKHKIHQFLHNLIFYSLTILIFTLFCSYPFWFPHLCASVNHFFFTSLPNLKSFFINPKFLFIVGNAIVIFLVGESKFATSSFRPSTTPTESQSHKDSVPLEKGQGGIEEGSRQMDLKEEEAEESDTKVPEEKFMVGEEKDDNKVLEVKYMVDEEKDDNDTDFDDGEICHDLDDCDKEESDEEDAGLPAQELKKRVEEFIARVNRQRWIESRQVAFGRG